MPEENEFIKEFECIGKWWFYGHNEEQYCGTLQFNIKNGGELILTKEDAFDLKNLWLQKPFIIQGYSNIGDVTLFDCKLISTRGSIGKLSTITLKSNEGIIGAHFANKDEILIQFLAINYSYLSKWCDSFGIIPLEILFTNWDKEEIKFTFKNESKLLTSGKGYSIFLYNTIEKRGIINELKKQIEFEENPYIGIALDNKNNLEDYQEFSDSIQYFLTIAIREQVFPLFIVGKTESNKQIKYFKKLPKTNEFSSFLVPNFSFSDIRDNMKECMEKWLANKEKLNSVCELYFSSLNSKFNSELRFLYVIQAVEALHRTILEKNKYIEDEEYRKEEGLYNKFISIVEQEDIDSSFKDSLRDKLKYENEYSLRKRLKDLLKENLELINARKSMMTDEIDDFIGRVVDTRDYYTHHDEDLKDRILIGEKLKHASKVLTALIEIVLMSTMGLSFEKIKELRKNQHPL